MLFGRAAERRAGPFSTADFGHIKGATANARSPVCAFISMKYSPGAEFHIKKKKEEREREIKGSSRRVLTRVYEVARK